MFFQVCRSGGWRGQSSRKMLEPGMCPAEMSLTPFVTRSLRLLCFSVTHRGRGKDSPLHFFLGYLLHQPQLLWGWAGKRVLFLLLVCPLLCSERPLCLRNARISFGAIQPPRLLVDEIRWNR
uniref:Uncharacterized protein n=1 Tax=Saimiri boliviensis boliviensis TaxID=39432 RepID=A0A2K6S7T7_SAIBB